mgnify:CR=1 FL=1
MKDKKKINTPEAESVEVVSPIEIISEAVKRCLKEKYCLQLEAENEKLKMHNIKLEADVSFWRAVACGALGTLFGILGAVLGFFIMTKIGAL